MLCVVVVSKRSSVPRGRSSDLHMSSTATTNLQASRWISRKRCRTSKSKAGKLFEVGRVSNYKSGNLGSDGETQEVPRLTPAQRAVVDMVHRGRNVFLTGSAGTGKSQVLHCITPHGRGHIALTAATGVAALILGGQTIHSWAGIGRAVGSAQALAQEVFRDAAATERWQTASVLVIDEISMISGKLLDVLDEIGRVVRRCPHLAFGGLQLLLCGDFYQLPPIGLEAEGWAFEARCWCEAIDVVVELTEVMRLDPGETSLAAALGQIRRGVVDDQTWQMLQVIAKRPRVSSQSAIEIVPTNRQADKINEAALQSVVGQAPLVLQPRTKPWIEASSKTSFEGELFVFEATELGPRSGSCAAFRTAGNDAPQYLKLCVGCNIVLIRSICLGPEKRRIPNGTICGVVGFARIPEELYNEQNPNLDEHAFNREERRFLSRHSGLLPRVRIDDEEGLVYPSLFTPNGQRGSTGTNVDGCVMQLPVRLGWAVTAHRAQGGNLGAAIVHLQGVFAHGQAYVALSRVRRASNLWIAGNLPQRRSDGSILAFAPDPKVAAFYAGLSTNV